MGWHWLLENVVRYDVRCFLAAPYCFSSPPTTREETQLCSLRRLGARKASGAGLDRSHYGHSTFHYWGDRLRVAVYSKFESRTVEACVMLLLVDTRQHERGDDCISNFKSN